MWRGSGFAYTQVQCWNLQAWQSDAAPVFSFGVSRWNQATKLAPFIFSKSTPCLANISARRKILLQALYISLAYDCYHSPPRLMELDQCVLCYLNQYPRNCASPRQMQWLSDCIIQKPSNQKSYNVDVRSSLLKSENHKMVKSCSLSTSTSRRFSCYLVV